MANRRLNIKFAIMLWLIVSGHCLNTNEYKIYAGIGASFVKQVNLYRSTGDWVHTEMIDIDCLESNPMRDLVTSIDASHKLIRNIANSLSQESAKYSLPVTELVGTVIQSIDKRVSSMQTRSKMIDDQLNHYVRALSTGWGLWPGLICNKQLPADQPLTAPKRVPPIGLNQTHQTNSRHKRSLTSNNDAKFELAETVDTLAHLNMTNVRDGVFHFHFYGPTLVNMGTINNLYMRGNDSVIVDPPKPRYMHNWPNNITVSNSTPASTTLPVTARGSPNDTLYHNAIHVKGENNSDNLVGLITTVSTLPVPGKFKASNNRSSEPIANVQARYPWYVNRTVVGATTSSTTHSPPSTMRTPNRRYPLGYVEHFKQLLTRLNKVSNYLDRMSDADAEYVLNRLAIAVESLEQRLHRYHHNQDLIKTLSDQPFDPHTDTYLASLRKYNTLYEKNINDKLDAVHLIIERMEQLTPEAPRRTKRGVFDFIGKIQNALFGVATEDMITDNTAALETIQQQLREHKDQILQISDTFQTALRRQSDSIVELTQATSDSLDVINKDISAMEGSLNALQEHAQQTTHDLSLSLNCLVLDSHVSLLESQLSLLGTKAYDLLSFMAAVAYMLETGHLDLRITDVTRLQSILAEINTRLGKSMELFTDVDPLAYYRSRTVALYPTPKQIRVIIRIPVRDKLDSYVTWKVNTIPYPIGEKWFKVMTKYAGLITCNNGWMGLTENEMNDCMRNVMHDCGGSSTWNSNWDHECETSILQTQDYIPESCTVEQVFMREYGGDVNNVIAQRLDDNSWLVSSSKEKTKVIQLCLDAEGQVKSDEVHTSHIFLLTVSPKCSAQVGSYTLVPRDSNKGNTSFQVKSYAALGDVIDKIPNVKINLEVKNITLHRRMWDSKNPLTGNLKYLAKSQRDSINHLLTGLNKSQELFIDKTDALEHETDEQIRKLKATIPGHSITSTIVATCVGVVVIGWLVMLSWYVCRGPGVFAATSLFANSAAGGIPINKIQEILDANSPPSADRQEQPISTYDVPTMIPDHTTTQSPNVIQTIKASLITQWFHMIMPILMFILMIIMLVLHVYHNRHIVHIIAHQMGFSAINKSGSHHAGESRLIINVVFEIKTWLNKRASVVVPVQLCTLPGDAKKWKCVQKGPLNSFFVSSFKMALCGDIEWRVNWGAICLQHPAMEGTDICEELPHNIKVSVSDIRSLIHCPEIPSILALKAIGAQSIMVAYPGYTGTLWIKDSGSTKK